MSTRAGPERVGLPARLAVVALAGVYGALALGNGLDRAAADRHDLIPLVPGPFRALSLAAAGGDAVKAGRFAQARDLGALAVARAPMEEGSTALLGLGRLLTHDDSGAEAAFRVAGTRGWRVPITQTYWMKAAYQLGDYPVAAIRLDALLRQQPFLTRQADVLAPFETNPPATAAMVDRLLGQPNWLGLYAQDVVGITAPQLAGRRVVLSALAARGLVLGCDRIGALTGELVRHGQVGEARALWASHCPAAGKGVVADSALAAPISDEQTFAPFSWRLFASGDVRITPQTAPGGRGQWLAVSNESPLLVPIMRQMVVAPAGRYRLTWLARDEAGQGSAKLEAYFGCDADNLAKLGAAQPVGGGRWQADVAVDGACAGHWLQFALRPGGGTVQLGEVALQRVGTGSAPE